MARITAGVASSHVPLLGVAHDQGKDQDAYFGPIFAGYEWTREWEKAQKPDVLDLWEINVSMWTVDYLQACAENGGKPPKNIQTFLPWNMSDKQLKTYGSTKRPEIKSKITEEQIRCATVDEVFQKKKSKLSEKLLNPLWDQKIEVVYQRKSAKGSTGPSPTVA